MATDILRPVWTVIEQTNNKYKEKNIGIGPFASKKLAIIISHEKSWSVHPYPKQTLFF